MRFHWQRALVGVGAGVMLAGGLAGCKGPGSAVDAGTPAVEPVVAPTNAAPAVPAKVPKMQLIRPLPPASSADTLSSNLLDWDAVFKEYAAKTGETNAQFTFHLTNVSGGHIAIYETTTSCECTIARLPAKPWLIAPGESGEIRAAVEIPEYPGLVTTNYVILYTSKGNKLLLMKTTAPR